MKAVLITKSVCLLKNPEWGTPGTFYGNDVLQISSHLGKNYFCEDYRQRSDCTHVQSDPCLFSSHLLFPLPINKLKKCVNKTASNVTEVRYGLNAHIEFFPTSSLSGYFRTVPIICFIFMQPKIGCISFYRCPSVCSSVFLSVRYKLICKLKFLCYFKIT